MNDGISHKEAPVSEHEPTTPRASRRVSRSEPPAPFRPSDSNPVSLDRLSDGAGIEDQEEYQFTDVKPGWRSETSWNCTICTLHGRAYDDIHNRAEFQAHIRAVHSRESGSEWDEPVPCVTACRWLCSVCRAESWYPVREPGKHGGPDARAFDRRFGWGYCRDSKYPSHKKALGNIEGLAGPILKYHEGLAFSEQPEQDDPSLIPFLPVKKPKKKEKNVRSNVRRSEAKPAPVERGGRATRGKTARASRVG